jgi:hypothetical protein
MIDAIEAAFYEGKLLCAFLYVPTEGGLPVPTLGIEK